MVSLSLAAVISRASLRASKPLAYQLYPGNMGRSNTIFRDWPNRRGL
jgi:hypothetical protein